MIGTIGKDKHGTFHPTGAGLLMFGNEYRIVRHYHEYSLDYREMLDPTIRWTDRLYTSSGEWTGNLFDFYFRDILLADRALVGAIIVAEAGLFVLLCHDQDFIRVREGTLVFDFFNPLGRKGFQQIAGRLPC